MLFRKPILKSIYKFFYFKKSHNADQDRTYTATAATTCFHCILILNDHSLIVLNKKPFQIHSRKALFYIYKNTRLPEDQLSQQQGQQKVVSIILIYVLFCIKDILISVSKQYFVVEGGI